jgi:hypothetical protein
MLPVHVALVANTEQVVASDLASVAAAAQLQATRDFGPMWGVSATVDAFPSLDDVPAGYWPVIVEDNINQPGAGGYHWDQNNQPYALVQYSDTWSLTVSHETLEMLGDPYGNRTHAGPSPADNVTQVQFLVEVCDPCEDAQFAYSINGILVSDFITPDFYDATSADGVKYSFTGAIPGPRQILTGGYVSYLDPSDNHMWQQVWPDGATEPEFKDLGPATQAQNSLREWVDSKHPHPQFRDGAAATIGAVAHARARRDASLTGRRRRSQILRGEIDALLRREN